jgi:hypothetical protein
MYYKRPSFKRGGSTGIAQLTPSRQGYAGGGNIGGGMVLVVEILEHGQDSILS